MICQHCYKHEATTVALSHEVCTSCRNILEPPRTPFEEAKDLAWSKIFEIQDRLMNYEKRTNHETYTALMNAIGANA